MNCANPRDLQILVGKQIEGVAAVILQPVAEGASADHAVSLAAQPVLQLAETHRFEEDDAVRVRPDPIQLTLPIAAPRDKACHCSLRQRFADRHLHLVTIGEQPQIERAKVARFGDAKYAHRAVLAGNWPSRSLFKPRW